MEVFNGSVLTHDVFTCLVENWTITGERMKMRVGSNQVQSSEHALRVRVVAKASKPPDLSLAAIVGPGNAVRQAASSKIWSQKQYGSDCDKPENNRLVSTRMITANCLRRRFFLFLFFLKIKKMIETHDTIARYLLHGSIILISRNMN